MLQIQYKNGQVENIKSEDGGGQFIGEGERYEIHITLPNGDPSQVFQDEVEKIIDLEDGKEIYWGNPYMGNHTHSPAEMLAIAKEKER